MVVALLANSAEPIPVAMRHRWLEEMLPWATVRSGVADHPSTTRIRPSTTSGRRRSARSPGATAFDLLLTSEPAYGDRRRSGSAPATSWWTRPGAPCPCRRRRSARDPYANWQYLAPGVRAWYARRVCLPGAESTGTTTMTELLADLYDTAWVPEYGREYSLPKDARGEAWTTAEFVHIARQQQGLEDEAARAANRILFCDTDALATAIWHEQYLGSRAPSVKEIARSRIYDLTFLTAADFPWVQDGDRNSDAARQRMQRRFEEELATRPEPVVELRGSIDQRLGTALAAIEHHLGLRPQRRAEGVHHATKTDHRSCRRLAGAVWGHLVGDADGRAVRVRACHGPRQRRVPGRRARTTSRAGTWSDDGALMLALLDSLLATPVAAGSTRRTRAAGAGLAATTAPTRPTALVFDIGGTTSAALRRLAAGGRRSTPGPPASAPAATARSCGSCRWRWSTATRPAAELIGGPPGVAGDPRASPLPGRLRRLLPRGRAGCFVARSRRRASRGRCRDPARVTGADRGTRGPRALEELEAWTGRGGRGFVLDAFWSAWDAFAGRPRLRGDDPPGRRLRERHGHDRGDRRRARGARWGWEAIPSSGGAGCAAATS